MLGLHTLYLYAAYGTEGGTASNVAAGQADSTGNAPELGNLTAILFAVVPIPTTTTVIADVNPQSSGSNVTFTATVTPGRVEARVRQGRFRSTMARRCLGPGR